MKPRHIRVKAVAGRIARTAPRGEIIPHDRFVNVEATPYVMRLLNHHHDLEQEPAKAPEKPKATFPVAETPAAMKGV